MTYTKIIRPNYIIWTYDCNTEICAKLLKQAAMKQTKLYNTVSNSYNPDLLIITKRSKAREKDRATNRERIYNSHF